MNKAVLTVIVAFHWAMADDCSEVSGNSEVSSAVNLCRVRPSHDSASGRLRGASPVIKSYYAVPTANEDAGGSRRL